MGQSHSPRRRDATCRGFDSQHPCARARGDDGNVELLAAVMREPLCLEKMDLLTQPYLRLHTDVTPSAHPQRSAVQAAHHGEEAAASGLPTVSAAS